ncbi:enhancer of mRNA-decapping protein 4-like isoform X2 [Branchiostoma floridae x Branchiostoma japonicum]
MDGGESSSTPSSLSTAEATQLLKDILNVGRTRDSDSSLSGSARSMTSQNGAAEMGEAGSKASGGGGGEEEPDKPGEEERDATQEAEQLTEDRQQILLQGDDTLGCVPIYGREVDILSSSPPDGTSSTSGSSRVKVIPVANYDWEHKYYMGSLVAINNTYIAYALKGKSHVVRVINRQTAERTLLKGFVGSVTDLGFAHLGSSLLACTDQLGNLFIWQIYEDNQKIQYSKKLQVMRPESTPPSNNHRLVWCPYIPEDGSASDTASSVASSAEERGRILALTHDENTEVWDVELVISQFGSDTIQVKDVTTGYITVEGSSKAPIADCSLSPDGAVLATASQDGGVKFWQVYLESDDPPRCLHKWQPHGGQPLSCLLFLDNHKLADPNMPFWRFLITGADYNRELKVWCTVSWTCLQTLRFGSSPSPGLSSAEEEPCLKACMDLSASYLVLSDITRKVLYVLQVYQNADDGKAGIVSLAEYLLTQPLLSFAIADASLRKFKSVNAEVEVEEDMTGGEGDHSASNDTGVLLKLFCVHTKSLQELQVRFKPATAASRPHQPQSIGSVSQDDIALRDGLSDMSVETLTDAEGSTSDLRGEGSQASPSVLEARADREGTPVAEETSPPPEDNAEEPMLLTPAAFTHERGDHTMRSSGSSMSSFTAVTPMGNSVANSLDGSASAHSVAELQDILQASPESSLTLTPTSTKQGTPDGPSHVPNPNTLPLPPLSPPEQKPLPPAVHARSPDLISSTSTSTDTPAASEALEQMFQQESQPRPPSSGSSLEEVLSPRIRGAEGMSPRGRGAEGMSPRGRPEVAEEAEGATGGEERPDSGHEPVQDEYGLRWPRAPDITMETARDRGHVEEASRTAQPELVASQTSSPPREQDLHNGQPMVRSPELQGAAAALPTTRHDQVLPGRSTPPKTVSPRVHRTEENYREVASPRTPPKRQAAEVSSAQLEQVLLLLRQQQQELEQLRGDVQKQQAANHAVLTQAVTQQLKQLHVSTGASVDKALQQHTQAERKRLDEALRERQDLDKQKQERLLSTVSQTLNSSITSKLEKCVKQEVKNSVLPAVTKSLDPVKDQLNVTMAQKLTATDSLMKENISKLVRAKTTVEAIGQSAAQAIQGPVQAAYKDAFQSTVVPMFEKACQSMFQQINDTFQRGTQDYLQQLEAHLAQQRQRQQQERDPVLTQLQGLVETFNSSASQLQDGITAGVKVELESQLQSTILNMQDVLISQVRRIVREEVSTALKEHQAALGESVVQAMRSRNVTPVPTPQADTQQLQMQIMALLRQGQFNTAFQQALTASDLSLVMFVCEAVSPAQVFSQTPCPLQQPVLLSLIQQLSVDLTHNTELKHRYLEESVMNLDLTHPVTCDHAAVVLSALCKKLNLFIQSEPNHKMIKNMRMLNMAAQSLMK